MTIYILEDDDAVRDSLQALLMGHGFEVKSYADAESFFAFEQAPLAETDTLIVDIGLPGRDGAAVLQTIATQGSGPARVVISGRQQSLIEKALSGVKYDYLFRKPLAAEKVAELISVLPTARH